MSDVIVGDGTGRGSKPRNGNNNLPGDRQKTVEAGLALFQQVQHERDDLREQLNGAQVQIAALQTQLEEQTAMRNTVESRVNTCIMERDQAVANYAALRAKYATVFRSIRVVLDEFVPPSDGVDGE